MILAFRYFIFALGFSVLVLHSTGCSKNTDNDTKHFMEIGTAFAKNINQLNKEPRITMTGFSSNPEKKLFRIGIATDNSKITPEHLKQDLESYLNNVAFFDHEQDYKKMLKPYNLRIEELGIDKNDAPLIAEKSSGSSEINWKEIK